MKKYTRWSKAIIENALKHRRVVILEGSRQCGKTTLAQEFINKDVIYRTLDDVSLLEGAQADPHNFVENSSNLMIIDEIQRAPLLLPAIKKVVDEDTRYGQFLLTGSANIQSLPSINESLAGRVKNIRLRPLSEGEIRGVTPTFLKNAFAQNMTVKSNALNRNQIIDIAFRGGFPEAIKLNSRERSSWHKDYLQAILQRDLKDIINIKRQGTMNELVAILAAWSSKFMDISSIGSSLSIQRTTLESYTNALEALYLIEKIDPWIKTDYDRVGKHSKIFMTDSGMMSSILKWKKDQLQFDSDKIGKLIETFIFNELSSQIDLCNDEYTLYHYRDREKREIDFLIEREDGMLLGIEVKSATTITKDSFKHLKWFQNNIAKKGQFIGIVLYTGKSIVSFGEGLWAVPMSILW